MTAPGPKTRTLETSSLDTLDAYRLLTHAVAPRPIAFVSTASAAGARNLAPFSFFMGGGASPPSVVISPTTSRKGGPNDTLRNIVETGEFVINLVSFDMRLGMNQASFPYPPEESEWPHAHFTAAPSRLVAPPRVAESAMSLECRCFQVIPHGSGPISANYVIGEVVCFHVAEHLFDATGQVDPRRVDYISRLGADWYGRITPDVLFELARPDSPEARWRSG